MDPLSSEGWQEVETEQLSRDVGIFSTRLRPAETLSRTGRGVLHTSKLTLEYALTYPGYYSDEVLTTNNDNEFKLRIAICRRVDPQFKRSNQKQPRSEWPFESCGPITLNLSAPISATYNSSGRAFGLTKNQTILFENYEIVWGGNNASYLYHRETLVHDHEHQPGPGFAFGVLTMAIRKVDLSRICERRITFEDNIALTSEHPYALLQLPPSSILFMRATDVIMLVLRSSRRNSSRNDGHDDPDMDTDMDMDMPALPARPGGSRRCLAEAEACYSHPTEPGAIYKQLLLFQDYKEHWAAHNLLNVLGTWSNCLDYRQYRQPDKEKKSSVDRGNKNWWEMLSNWVIYSIRGVRNRRGARRADVWYTDNAFNFGMGKSCFIQRKGLEWYDWGQFQIGRAEPADRFSFQVHSHTYYPLMIRKWFFGVSQEQRLLNGFPKELRQIVLEYLLSSFSFASSCSRSFSSIEHDIASCRGLVLKWKPGSTSAVAIRNENSIVLRLSICRPPPKGGFYSVIESGWWPLKPRMSNNLFRRFRHWNSGPPPPLSDGAREKSPIYPSLLRLVSSRVGDVLCWELVPDQDIVNRDNPEQRHQNITFAFNVFGIQKETDWLNSLMISDRHERTKIMFLQTVHYPAFQLGIPHFWSFHIPFTTRIRAKARADFSAELSLTYMYTTIDPHGHQKFYFTVHVGGLRQTCVNPVVLTLVCAPDQTAKRFCNLIMDIRSSVPVAGGDWRRVPRSFQKFIPDSALYYSSSKPPQHIRLNQTDSKTSGEAAVSKKGGPYKRNRKLQKFIREQDGQIKSLIERMCEPQWRKEGSFHRAMEEALRHHLDPQTVRNTLSSRVHLRTEEILRELNPENRSGDLPAIMPSFSAATSSSVLAQTTVKLSGLPREWGRLLITLHAVLDGGKAIVASVHQHYI